MPLTDSEFHTAKTQRDSINDALIRNGLSREAKSSASFEIGINFYSAILTISLGLGAAIIPLLLTIEIRPDHRLFFSIASVLLLSNSIYLSIILKNYAEKFSFHAMTDGIQERYLLVKLRNLLTKAILTKDESYFRTYNQESRKLAENSVDESARDGTLPKLTYSSDISLVVLVSSVMLVARPLFNVSDEIYFILCAVALYVQVIYFIRLNDKYKKLHANAGRYNSLGLNEEKEFNQFIRGLSEGKDK